MILKRLFEKYHFDINSIILKEYKRLNLNRNEAWVLCGLITQSQNKKTTPLSLGKLATSLDMEERKIECVLQKLNTNNYYTIELKTDNNGKANEIINFDYTFQLIEQLISDDAINEKLENSSSEIKKIILEVEQGLKRVLSPRELALLKNLYAVDNIPYDEFHRALKILNDRHSLNFYALTNYMNGFKQNRDNTSIEIDEDTTNSLKSLFAKVK